MPYDPLDGIEGRPADQQIAMLAVEMRSQRNALAAQGRELKEEIRDVKVELKTDVSVVRHDVKWILRGVWALAGPVLVGLILYVLTGGGHP